MNLLDLICEAFREHYTIEVESDYLPDITLSGDTTILPDCLIEGEETIFYKDISGIFFCNEGHYVKRFNHYNRNGRFEEYYGCPYDA